MPKGPLSHITVLDLSRVLAGPWCAQILGDLGAEVIKVENPKTGDDTRGWGPPFLSDEQGEPADAAYYLCANRNKRSIAVNIAVPEGQDIIRKLAAKSDVVLENYKTGGLKKYGLDYEGLKAVNPDLVYCSITGFGHDGPRAHLPGYDFLIQAMGGLMSITGHDKPSKVGVPLVDLFTGVYASSAILAALTARDKGAGGQFIDMALFDVQVAILANQATNYLVGGKAPGLSGNGHPNIVPYQVFPAEDGEIIIAAGNDRQFQDLCRVLDAPALASDPRYATNASRVEHRDDLVAQLTVRTRGLTKSRLLEALDKSKVPASPINTIEEVFDDPQIKSRGLQINPEGVPGVRSPIQYSNQTLVLDCTAPKLGEHNDLVRQHGWNLPKTR